MTLDYLHGVETIEMDDGTRVITTVKSSVIGVVGTAAQGPVNVPVLILGSQTKGAQTFGPQDGLGTIPDTLDAIFDQGVGPTMVFINVCDPAVHKTSVADADFTFSASGLIALGRRHVSAVTVKSSDGATTHVAGTDYSVEATTGLVTRIATGGIAALAQVKVSYTYVDPSKVTMADIIGGVDEAGRRGVQALLDAESVVGVTPRVLIAPGFTSARSGGNANPVVADLLGVATRLRAVILADGPGTTDEEAVAYRGDWGSSRLYVIDPAVVVYDTLTASEKIAPASGRAAGVLAWSDSNRGFWWSPSNTPILGIVGTSRPIQFALSDKDSQSNYLNGNEVATIIRKDGFRLWGNRTTSTDPKWAFLSVRRTCDMIYESIEENHLWAMDRPFSANLLEEIAEGVNAYLRYLKGRGALLGGRCWLDPEVNTKEEWEGGNLIFDFDLEPPAPMERLTFRARRNNGYYEELLTKVISALTGN